MQAFLFYTVTHEKMNSTDFGSKNKKNLFKLVRYILVKLHLFANIWMRLTTFMSTQSQLMKQKPKM